MNASADREQQPPPAPDAGCQPSAPGSRSVGFAFCLLIFIAAAALNLAWLGRAPLFDTTEARHAEVAREFVADGHWLVPAHNGWPHLTKPPLTDWLGAAGMLLFGPNEFGARFANALAAALAVALTAALAGAIAGRSAALPAAVIMMACPLHLALSRVISIDVILAALSAGFFLALWRLTRPDCRRRWLHILLLGLLLGLGAMAKGHIALLLMFAPALAWALTAGLPGNPGDPYRRRAGPVAIGALAVLAVAAAVALPWFLYIIQTFPGWLETIARQEFGERIAGDGSNRYVPGLAIGYFLGGCLPALPLAVVAVLGCRLSAAGKAVSPEPLLPRGACSLLLLGIALPLLVFGLAQGQRMNYVEPLVPALAVLAGAGWSRLSGSWAAAGAFGRAMAHATAVLAVVAGLTTIGLLAFFPNPAGIEFAPGQALWVVAAGAAAVLAGLLGLLALRHGRAALAGGALAAAAGTLWLLAPPTIEAHHAHHSTRESCRFLRERMARGERVLAYRNYVHSLGFYLGGRIPVVLPTGDTRTWARLWPEWTASAGAPSAPTWQELVGEVQVGRPGVWLVTSPRHVKALAKLNRKTKLRLELHRFERDVVLVRLRPRNAPGRTEK